MVAIAICLGAPQILDKGRQVQTVETDRSLFRACLAAFRASGWWSEEQIAEYTQIAGQIMNGSDTEAKQAARDFWIDRTGLGKIEMRQAA